MLEGRLDVETDDAVRFRYRVKNPDDEPSALTFRDAGQADLAVFDANDREVWRWSDGKMFAQMIEEASLAPGEEVTFDFEWGSPEPGEYRACASLRTMEDDCETECEFAVE